MPAARTGALCALAAALWRGALTILDAAVLGSALSVLAAAVLCSAATLLLLLKLTHVAFQLIRRDAACPAALYLVCQGAERLALIDVGGPRERLRGLLFAVRKRLVRLTGCGRGALQPARELLPGRVRQLVSVIRQALQLIASRAVVALLDCVGRRLTRRQVAQALREVVQRGTLSLLLLNATGEIGRDSRSLRRQRRGLVGHVERQCSLRQLIGDVCDRGGNRSLIRCGCTRLRQVVNEDRADSCDDDDYARRRRLGGCAPVEGEPHSRGLLRVQNGIANLHEIEPTLPSALRQLRGRREALLQVGATVERARRLEVR